ncbi:MAG: hypothetical protein EOP36_00215 [Rubrivivax sp.]|nr:MAG: hypothetical protein EOP36_00215 [Rubrivivax sp.]
MTQVEPSRARLKATRLPSGKAIVISAGVTLAVLLGVLSWSQVETDLSADDAAYVKKFYPAAVTLRPATWEEQLHLIKAVQAAVIDRALLRHDIPEGQAREPRDVWNARSGLCYDVSRTIEKILSYQGFEVRHLYIGRSRTQDVMSAIALLGGRVQSHAVSEVKTAAGWLIVDSTSKWLSLDPHDRPVSVRELHANRTLWLAGFGGPVPDLFKEDFFFITGLYSRHGKFYSPFNAVPDVAWDQFYQGMVVEALLKAPAPDR